MVHTSLLFLNIGTPEMLIIFAAALLLFGGKKLPELARGLGKGIREFKDASDDVKREINNQINNFQEEPKPGTKMISGVPVAVDEEENQEEEYREPDYSSEQPVIGTPLAETSTVVASVNTTNENEEESETVEADPRLKDYQ